MNFIIYCTFIAKLKYIHEIKRDTALNILLLNLKVSESFIAGENCQKF